MSLNPIESKHKKLSEIKTGTHLVIISDIFILKNSNKEPIKINGFLAIIVKFKDILSNIHEQIYIMDDGFKQKYFTDMLNSAQVTSQNNKPDKKEILNKKLWISIQEIHYVEDDKIVNDFEGNPKIEYQIFKTNKYIEGMKKPILKGDESLNNGIYMDSFITYKNISISDHKEFPVKDSITPSFDIQTE